MPSPKKRRVGTPESNISQIIGCIKTLLNTNTDISVWRQCNFQDAHLEGIKDHFSKDPDFLIDIITQDRLEMLHSFFLDENADIPFVAIMRKLFQDLTNSDYRYYFEIALADSASILLSEKELTFLIDIAFSLYLLGDKVDVQTLFMGIYVSFYTSLESSSKLKNRMTDLICEKIAIMDTLMIEETPLLKATLKELCIVLIGKAHRPESKQLLQTILNTSSVESIRSNLQETQKLLIEVVKTANEEKLVLDKDVLALLLESYSLNTLMIPELMTEIEKNPSLIPFMESYYHDTDVHTVPDIDNPPLSYTAPEEESSIKRDFSVPEQMEDDIVHIPRRLERRSAPVDRAVSNETDISFSFMP